MEESFDSPVVICALVEGSGVCVDGTGYDEVQVDDELVICTASKHCL